MIKRKLFSELKDHLNKPEISLIVGPRQAGKTTLMRWLEDELKKAGKKTVFLNLDLDTDRPHFESQEKLLTKIKLEIGKQRGFVFIDEIQRKENAGLFLKGLYDRQLPYKFIVSGSGSVELKEKIHESLAGRKRVFELATVSFEEFLDFKTDYRYEGKLKAFLQTEKIKGENLFLEYLSFGGYPRVVLAETIEEKRQVITEIYQSYIQKDIAYLLRVQKIDSLTNLVYLLANQIGSMVNLSELSSTLGIALNTVSDYLWYLEKTFIVDKVTPFFRNARSEISKSPVYYFQDLGMANFAKGRFELKEIGKDGHLFENFVYLQLKEKASPPERAHFYRTKDKAEVDFVIDKGKGVEAIEVKFKKLTQPKISRSFRNFLKRYKPLRAVVIHLGERMEREGVEFVPWRDLVFSILREG